MFAVGDKVHLAPEYATPQYAGRTYLVEKVPARAGENYVVREEFGVRGLRVKEHMLRAGEAPSEVEPMVTFLPGTVVVFRNPEHVKGDSRGYFVVCASEKNGHRLFRLGGSDRYYRSVKGTQIQEVPLSELHGKSVA